MVKTGLKSECEINDHHFITKVTIAVFSETDLIKHINIWVIVLLEVTKASIRNKGPHGE